MKKIVMLSSALLGIIFLAAGCSQQPAVQTQPTVPSPVTQPTTQVQPTTSVPVTQQTLQPTTTDQSPNEDNGPLKTYQNQKYGFEFKYPKAWETYPQTIMGDWGEKDNIRFTSGFSVSVWDTSTYSIDDLKAAPPGGIDPDSVKETKIAVDKNPATETSYTLVKDTASGSSSGKKILIQKNNLVYLIEGGAEECATVIPTFKFIK